MLKYFKNFVGKCRKNGSEDVKLIIKRTATLIISIGLLFSIINFNVAYGQPVAEETFTAKVTLDGKTLSFEQQPINVNGRVLVPMRNIFEALGAKVEWDNDNRIATGTLGTKIVKIPIDSKTVFISGKEVSIEEPARIVGERTLVPARVVSEGLGASVSWDQDSSTVIIVSPVKESETKPGETPVEKPEEEKLEKLGVVYPPFSYYSQFGWGLDKSTEYSMCVTSCWAMMINNMGIPANPVDVYAANGNSTYIVWSKMTSKFGVKTDREIVNVVEITEKATSENSDEYKEACETIVRKYLKDNPQGVMLNFNKGTNKELHSVVAIEDKDGVLYFHDPSAGERVTFDKTYMFKRGQGWGNLYTIQTVSKSK